MFLIWWIDVWQIVVAPRVIRIKVVWNWHDGKLVRTPDWSCWGSRRCWTDFSSLSRRHRRRRTSERYDDEPSRTTASPPEKKTAWRSATVRGNDAEIQMSVWTHLKVASYDSYVNNMKNGIVGILKDFWLIKLEHFFTKVEIVSVWEFVPKTSCDHYLCRFLIAAGIRGQYRNWLRP